MIKDTENLLQKKIFYRKEINQKMFLKMNQKNHKNEKKYRIQINRYLILIWMNNRIYSNNKNRMKMKTIFPKRVVKIWISKVLDKRREVIPTKHHEIMILKEYLRSYRRELNFQIKIFKWMIEIEIYRRPKLQLF